MRKPLRSGGASGLRSGTGGGWRVPWRREGAARTVRAERRDEDSGMSQGQTEVFQVAVM